MLDKVLKACHHAVSLNGCGCRQLPHLQHSRLEPSAAMLDMVLALQPP